MTGAFNRCKDYLNIWEWAKDSTEEYIDRLRNLTKLTSELGTYKLGFIVDTLTITHNEKHKGYIMFNMNSKPLTLKEIGFFKEDIQYKFDEDTVSELILEPPFWNPEFPFFEYVWSNTPSYCDPNLISLQVTLDNHFSARYRAEDDLGIEIVKGFNEGRLPKSIKGIEHLLIKKDGENIQHDIRWSVASELMKISTFDGSKFEEAVDALYKRD